MSRKNVFLGGLLALLAFFSNSLMAKDPTSQFGTSYWSSTESSGNPSANVWYTRFNFPPLQGTNPKTGGLAVMCARIF